MRSLRRAVACILVVWYLPACTTYRVASVTPQQAVQGEEEVIVTVRAGRGLRTFRVEQPWASTDSVGGIACVTEGRARGWRCQADSIWTTPISAVHSVQTKQKDTPKTLIAVGATIALLAVAGALLAPSMSPDLGQMFGEP